MDKVFAASVAVLIDKHIPIGTCDESKGMIQSDEYPTADGTAMESIILRRDGDDPGATVVQWRSAQRRSEAQKNVDEDSAAEKLVQAHRSEIRCLRKSFQDAFPRLRFFRLNPFQV